MKKLLIIALAIGMMGCENKSNYHYLLYKSDDNNWTTSARIECNSFKFITSNHVEFFVDGKKSNLMGGSIQVYTNENYKK